GRAPSTSPPGSVWRPTTRYRAVRFYRHAPNDPEVVSHPYCGWRRSRLAGPKPPWEPSIGDCRRASAKPKPSPRPRARSRFCSTTRCDTAWIMSIRGLPIYYETRYRERVVKNLHRRAKALGYIMLAADAPTAVPAVSYSGIPRPFGNRLTESPGSIPVVW